MSTEKELMKNLIKFNIIYDTLFDLWFEYPSKLCEIYNDNYKDFKLYLLNEFDLQSFIRTHRCQNIEIIDGENRYLDIFLCANGTYRIKTITEYHTMESILVNLAINLMESKKELSQYGVESKYDRALKNLIK